MSEYQFAALESDIPANGMKLVEIDDEMVLVVQVDGQFYCIDDVCTHDGGTLCDGELSGYSVACPRHGATFDVRTGEATKMPATQATGAHEVKVEDGKIFVKLADE